MLAAIGQLAAVFVGIPSLIYLAVQIREQTKERRQSAVNALTAQWGDLTCALHESAEFCCDFSSRRAFFRTISMRSRNSDSARFSIGSLKTFEGMYFSHCDGILSGSSWGEIERTMSDFIAYHGVQQWWDTRRHWHTEEFAPRRRRNHRQRRRAQGLLNLQSTRDRRAENTRMNNLACIHW